MADDPIPPFDATVAGVQALLPHATFVDEKGVGQKALSTADVATFVEDITGRVQARLGHRWETLDEPLLTVIHAAGRDVVHNGAASYAQAARFPEQADKALDTYAEVLWQRYLDGLDALAAMVAGWVDDETPDGGTGVPVGSFPCARITEDTRF